MNTKTKIGKVQTIVVVASLLASFFVGFASPVRAAPTTSVLGGGIAINEILIDPNSATNNFDTDGNGTAETLDEFVEIYNLSGTAIDISGFQLWDAGNDNWFTFPGSTTLGAGNYAVVVCGVQSGGSLPAVSGGNLAFDAGRSGGVINNGGDNVVLYDPGADQYIQLRYNGDAADNPPVDYAGDGFSSTATLVETMEDWGSDSDGISLVRDPAGDTNVVRHNTISSDNASPGDASGAPEPEASELLLTEIVVTPTAGEFIEIYNPTGDHMDLTDVYLTDATYAGGGTYYYNIVTGSNAGGGGFSDFHARFPDGATINPGEYQTIALNGSGNFFTEYGVNPTYELYEDGAGPDAIPDMREALPGSINNQGGLTNNGEVVILYYWDGNTDLVTDLDYAVWGDKVEAVDKTGVSIDGPDADADTSAYLNDTVIGSQDVVYTDAHAYGSSWQRADLSEGNETKTGGNGAGGHDETSEDLSNTWCENTPTPNAASSCGISIAQLLLSEIVVTPTAGEFVEIYNPGDTSVDLSNVYLTDATYAGGGTYYYNIVTGSNAGGGGFSDFHARFPDGATIAPGEYQTIALNGSDNFFTEYGGNPTYELYEDGAGPDAIPDMREALPGSINNQGGLTNNGEVVILYYWDGSTDLVIDLDYAVWGDKAEAVDKTGVSIDGPDADADTSAYLNDTVIGSQDVVYTDAHAYGSSWQRADLSEGNETKTGGNGADGHDETSEDLSNTWCENTPTPNAASTCGISDWVINEIHADPDSTNGDANGDGEAHYSDDEFVEIVNISDSDVDISGWTLSDGYGVRHSFLEGTVVSANCAVVVFGGGTPTGAFGGAVVQTANGAYSQLGLNNSGDTVTLNDGSTDLATVAYGSEGGDNQSLTLDPDITGTSFVKHSTATGSGSALFSPGTRIFNSSFLGCSGGFGTCQDPATPIHVIQGNDLSSPLNGAAGVIIEGVVVGDFQESDELDGFFVQDPAGDGDPATSDGIFVYAPGATDVVVGEHVRVRGTVNEYNELTEIGYVDLLLSCGTGDVDPTPVDLPVGVDLEPYEGMLVTFPEELTASQNYFQGRYGQVTLSAEGRLFNPTNIYRPLTTEAIALAAGNMRRMIVLDDGTSSQNVYPIPYIGAYDTLRAGDTVAGLTGVVDYGPINSSYPPARYYRLHPTQEPVEFTRVNERTTAPSDVGGVIKITSFNVLNYFNGDGMGGGFPTSRGADTLDEFNRQRDKIISAIVAMDADVIGLMEIENDGYDQYSAIADLVNGLNDVTGAGTYAFIDPGVALVGADEIAVGFIYKPGTVTPVGTAAILDSSVDPAFNSDYNRPAIAQTFERSTGGGRFTAVVNHLKSKGSPCDDIGDPDIGDGQGNCNLTRESAAIALTNWLSTDPTGSDDDDFFIIGDLNSYAKEDPIIAIEDAEYTNLVELFDGTWAYSYIFDGQAGYLDHALASPSAVPQVMGATVWHINTDEPSVIDYNVEYKSQDLYTPTPYRSSDHDPVVVGFCEAVPPVVEVNVTPDTLWPPNHKYVIVQAIVNATDNLDPNPAVALLSVTSNEPDDGLGDGDTPDDIVMVDDFTFKLRAERSGTGDGRIYTITYEVTDACGNSTVATATVTVPHDQGK